MVAKALVEAWMLLLFSQLGFTTILVLSGWLVYKLEPAGRDSIGILKDIFSRCLGS